MPRVISSRLLITCLGCLAASQLGAFETSGLLEIHVMSVRHANAMLVVGPDGTRVLMDAGHSRMAPYLLDINLAPNDPDRTYDFDFSIASHLDEDHITHFDNLKTAGYRFGTNYFNNSNKPYTPGSVIDKYRKALGPVQAELTGPSALLDLGQGAELRFLASNCRLFTDPLTDVPDCMPGSLWETGCCRPNEENDKSIAVLITYGDFQFLWAGDLSGANKDGHGDDGCTGRAHSSTYGNMETLLAAALTTGPDAPLGGDGVDVLHVSHHGADSATNKDWMNALRPEVAVISVGPSLGDPEPGVVEGVLGAQATDDCVTVPAALVFQTDEGHTGTGGASEAGLVVGNLIIETDGVFYGIGSTGTDAYGDPVPSGDFGQANLPTFLLTDENAPDCPLMATVSGPLLIDNDWTWKGLHSLTTEGSVRIAAGGDVTFQAGSGIDLGNGFQVDEGGEFEAKVGIVLECDERWPPETWATPRSLW